MGDLVIILIVVVGLVFGVRATIKHMKGQGGGCCGGGSVPKAAKKTLSGKIIGEKAITIEGMHCENCKNSVERQLNRIINDEELKKAVEKADFKVVRIESAM